MLEIKTQHVILIIVAKKRLIIGCIVYNPTQVCQTLIAHP